MRRKLRPRNLSADRAGCHPHVRIVADALVFTGIAACHHIQIAALLGEPNRHGDRRAILPQRSEADVTLVVNLRGDRIWHASFYEFGGRAEGVGRLSLNKNEKKRADNSGRH